MFRKIVSSALALSVAFAPLATSASTDTYMFRYASGLSIGSPSPEIPSEPEEYGVGNDITAYFVAPIGYDFSKKIPVAAQDVVDWRKDSGELPAGIFLDESTGHMSGRPTAEGKQSLLYRGWDAGGNRIARAALNFTVFTPVGAGRELAFYGHTGTYFYQTIPLPEGVDVYRWESIIGYPEGMSMKGLAFQGTPAKAGTYAIAWRGYNYVGREVAFAWGEFLVEDGPKIEDINDQIVSKGYGWFNVHPEVKHSLGTLVYSLVPEEGRPEGLQFTPETGRISGIYRTYNTSAKFHIDVTDSADGRTSSSNTFTLATLPQDLELCCITDLEGTVNSYFWQRTSGTVADGKYEVLQGQLPEGMEISEKSGIIYGTPKKAEVQDGIVIGVSGAGVASEQSPPFKFTIYPEEITASIIPSHVRVGEAFSTKAPDIRTGKIEPFSYALVAGASIDPRLTLDPSTGAISSAGIAEPGTYDATLVITNADGQTSKPIIQPITVHNPLSVAYADTTVNRLKPLALDPVIDKTAIVGRGVYRVAQGYLPSWMVFDPRTGRFSGTPLAVSQERVYGPYVVTIEDDTRAVQPSAPFLITVTPRDDLSVDILNDVAERYVPNQKITADAQNAYGNVRYSMSAGSLGGTLKISETGVLVGSTQDPVGTIYSGIVVTARDEDDSIGVSSAPFSITVVAPSDPKPLLGSFDLTKEWAADTPFSFELPELSNGYGTVAYALATPSSDVVVSTDGKISGTLATGVHSFEYTIADDVPGRAPARGTIMIVVKDPMTVAMDDVYQAHVGSHLSILPVVTNPVGTVTYQFQGALPSGLGYKDGLISKAPTAEGLSDILTLTVSDEAGTVVVKRFRINVGPALPFSVSYEPALLRADSGAGLPVQPRPVSPLGKMSYALKSGLFPLGVDFKDGYFYGTPHETGVFKFVVTATDAGLDDSDAADNRSIDVDVELKVAPAEDMSFPKTSFTVRKGAPFSLPLSVDDAFGAVTFAASSAAGIPHNLILSPAGALTGSLSEAKAYDGIEVKATDEFGRIAEATMTVTAVDALTASLPTRVDFKQYSEGSASVAAVNPAGTLSYEWAAGSVAPPQGITLDKATGVISGTPEVFGDFAGYQIVVTDAFDGTTAETNEFTIKIAERDPLVLTPPAPLALKRFSVASARATVTDPVGSVLYDVTPDLPSGIDLDETSGEISGSSEDIVPSTVHIMTATDEKAGDLGTDVKTFTLEVAERDPLQIIVADSIVFKQHGEDSKGATARDPVGAVQWTISPALPDGLTFSDGIISGTSHEVVPPSQYTITAVDSKGGDLGSAEAKVSVSVEERDALAPSVPASYEFNQFFEGGFSATAGNVLGAASWSFNPALTDWMIASVDAKTGDLKISGTPQDLMDPTDYALTVSDAYDTASPKTISISVGERKPLKIKSAAADGQAVELPGLIGYPFTTMLEAENARGALTWKLVSGTLPADVTFDETKGAFKGTASVYGSFPGIVISVADEKGGLDQRSFTLNIGQDGSPISISAANPAAIHVGMSVTTPAPAVTNSVGAVTFSATGLAGTGLSIDSASGVISGTPAATGQIKATVYVTDITQRVPDVPAVVTITVLPAITVAAVAETALVYNYDPAPAVPTAKDSVPANIWSLKSGRLPAGVTVDPLTGSFVGKPKEVGTFGPVVISVTDSLGGTGSSANLTVKVKMNDDPIDLAVTDLATHVGFDIRTQAPVYGNELGTVTFFSPDAVAQGLTIDAATGVISGKIDDVRDVIINVSVRDAGTLRVTSQPLKLQILPPVEVVLPAKVTALALEQMAEVAPTIQYAIGNMIWDPASDPSRLPPGVTFDTATGSFKGIPTELGTFGPVTISGTDAVGGKGTSEMITFEVRPGAKFIGLADAVLPDGVKRSDWSFDFSTIATIVGFEPADLEWSIVAPNMGIPPADLTANGAVLSGQPNKSGDYLIDVTLKPKDTNSTVPAVTKTYALKVTIPPTSITLPASLPGGEAVVAYSYDFKTSTALENVPLSSISWSLILDKDPSTLPAGVVNDLPPGMTLNTTHQTLKGLLSGTPTKGGTYIFSVKAQFKDSEEDVSDILEYTIEIEGSSFRFKMVDAGNGTGTCGVTTDSRVACWGSNTYGQAGDGTTGTFKRVPVYVSGVTDAKAVAVGLSSACAIVGGGSVKCWGRNTLGDLGDGTGVDSAVPVDVAGISSATVIDGYGSHYCVGLSEGGAKCWGQGAFMQLGDGTKVNAFTPVSVASLTGSVRQIAATRVNTCAIMENNSVWCWGTNADSSLGAGGNMTTPAQIVGIEARSIAGGDTHYCAITTGGAVKCWGRGNNWQLGPGTVAGGGNKSAPTQVAGLTSGVKAIGLGYLHSCAVTSSGAVQCWGWDDGGQQGDGKAGAGGTVQPYGANVGPTQVVGLTTGAVMVAGGRSHTCTVMVDGAAKCWGQGEGLGNGVNVNTAAPVNVGTQ